jgi:hypothetical protein
MFTPHADAWQLAPLVHRKRVFAAAKFGRSSAMIEMLQAVLIILHPRQE